MLGLMLQVAFTGKPMGFLRVNSPGCLLLFFRAIFIHTIPIASLFFYQRPVCCCLISGAKVVRVLKQKQGRAFQVCQKISTHPGCIFFQSPAFAGHSPFYAHETKHSILRLFRRIKKNVRNEN